MMSWRPSTSRRAPSRRGDRVAHAQRVQRASVFNRVEQVRELRERLVREEREGLRRAPEVRRVHLARVFRSSDPQNALDVDLDGV